MTCNPRYANIIRRRIRILWLILATLLVIMVVAGETGGRDTRFMSRFTADGGHILYWWGMIWVIVRIVYNKKLLKDRLRLKEKQLHEWDERRRYLHRMSGGYVMDIFLVLNWIAAIIASCYDNEAFYAAYGLLTAAALLKAGAYWAYSKDWL